MMRKLWNRFMWGHVRTHDYTSKTRCVRHDIEWLNDFQLCGTGLGVCSGDVLQLGPTMAIRVVDVRYFSVSDRWTANVYGMVEP